MITAAPPERLVPLANVHNFRDLGGYRTADGRTTKWRTIYRADALNRLDAGDLDIIRPLGIRTVIDLRTDEELDARGRFPLDGHPVDFHHVSIIDRAWNQAFAEPEDVDAADFLVMAYRHMLAEGADRMGAVIRLLADADHAPAVFHCAAGKDRTGLVAALTLAAVGVADEDIVDDFGQTVDAMARTRAWAERNDPDLFERFKSLPKMFMSADPRAMQVVLADLRAAHGSIDRFLDSIGVGADVRTNLGAHFVE